MRNPADSTPLLRVPLTSATLPRYIGALMVWSSTFTCGSTCGSARTNASALALALALAMAPAQAQGLSLPDTPMGASSVPALPAARATASSAPYHTQEITLLGAEGTRLAGTLTLPEGKGPFAAALLLSGSGPQDRDNTLAGHPIFRTLAEHLAAEGIATLRLDDRGVGGSGGWLYAATYDTLATDARMGLSFLRAQPRIDPAQVGLIGHSEGASIAMLSQAQSAQDTRAAFAVLLAGPTIGGEALLAGQVAQDYAGAGKQKLVRDRLQREWNASPYLSDFLAYQPAKNMRAVAHAGMPILALYGERDTQVFRAAGVGPARRILADAPHAAVREWPSLNHLFQRAGTGRPSEYARMSTGIDAEVLQAIAAWLKSLSR